MERGPKKGPWPDDVTSLAAELSEGPHPPNALLRCPERTMPTRHAVTVQETLGEVRRGQRGLA